MKTFTLYRKTLTYSWLKFMLSIASAIIAIVLFLLLYTGLSTIGEGPGSTGFIFWIILCPFIYPMVKYFLGHRIFAGHLYAIREAIATEHLPVNLLKSADTEVLLLFPTFAHYKARELEAANSIKELYRRILDSAEETPFTAGAKESKLYLSSITAACIAQIFAKPAQMQEMTLVQSIAIFFRNRQIFLSDAHKASRKILISIATFGVIMVTFCTYIILLIAGTAVTTVILGIVLGLILTAGIKNAFIDTIYIIRNIKTFILTESADKEIYESYTKMATLSPSYAKLWKKASGESVDLDPAADNSIVQTQE